MSKKIISYILSVCTLTSSLFFSMPVKAETAKDAYMGVNDAFVLLRSIFEGLGAVTGIVSMDTLVKDYLKADEYWSSRYDELKDTVDISGADSPIYYNNENNTYIFKPQYFNSFFNYANDYVHRMDGYYLLEPDFTFNTDDFLNTLIDKYYDSYPMSESKEKCFAEIEPWTIIGGIRNNVMCYTDKDKVYLFTTNSNVLYLSNMGTMIPIDKGLEKGWFVYHIYSYRTDEQVLRHGSTTSYNFSFLNHLDTMHYSGTPLMIFYNDTSYEKYLDNGKSYVPNINYDKAITVPANIFNTGDFNNYFNYDLGDTSAMTETEIQNAIDSAVKQALDNMQNATPTPTPDVTVTPTPTPTPKPTETPIPDDSPDFTVTNAWLKKIYEYFQTFGKSHDTFAQKITDYIEKNDGKLDQIITALEKIVSGQPSGESSGCKYDYTVLSDFLTKLWNESDKKFDNMVKLLEENNEYQQKIVTSLNEIKALLIVDTVLDFFQNRSQETANKAKEKFPTSIPWDIAMVVNAMCAEPESPVIRCPIKIESLGINEELVVDLSQDEWAKLAKTCRSMLSILFVLYMIHLTRELFFKGGDA